MSAELVLGLAENCNTPIDPPATILHDSMVEARNIVNRSVEGFGRSVTESASLDERVGEEAVSVAQFLGKYYLEYYDQYQVLKCCYEECNSLVTNKPWGHLYSRHSINVTKVDRMTFESLNIQFNEEYYGKGQGTPAALPFLPVTSGYKCSVESCTFKSEIKRRIRSHCTTSGHENYIPCKLQNFSLNNAPKYSEVYLPLKVEEFLSQEEFSTNGVKFTTEELETLFNAAVQDIDIVESVEQRSIFYSKMHWHEEGEDKLDARYQWRPADSESPMYKFVVSEIEALQKWLPSANHIIRQEIANCTDGSGPKRPIFTIHQDKKTIALYAKSCASFVSFLQKMVANEEWPPNEVSIAVLAFIEDQSKASLFEALYCTLTESVSNRQPRNYAYSYIKFCSKYDDGSLMPAEEVSRLAARFLYIWKALAVYQICFAIDSNHECELKDRFLRLFDCRKFNVFRMIAGIKTQAMGLSNGEKPNLLNLISESPLELAHGNYHLSIPSLQKGFRNSLLEMKSLQQKLVFGNEISIDESRISENMAMEKSGWRFEYGTSDEERKLKSTLLSFVNTSDSLWSNFFGKTSSGEIFARPAAYAKYLGLYMEYQRALLFCVHISAGPPGRITEEVVLRITNGPSSYRSILFYEGQVVFLYNYNKTTSKSKKYKTIARFLPFTLGTIVLIDLLVIRPFLLVLTKLAQPSLLGCYSFNLFIMPSGKMTATLARDAIKQGFLDFANAELDSSGYRQMAQFFGEYFEIGVKAGDSILNKSMGHGNYAAVVGYGFEAKESMYIRASQLFDYRNVCTDWQLKVLGISAEPVKVAVQVEEIEQEIVRREYQPVPRVKRVFEEEEGLAVSCEEKAKSTLRSLFKNQSAEFNSIEQQVAVNHVLFSSANLILVLPTGGGKSLLFFAEAKYYTSKCFIIVVPLISLQMDLKRRAEELDISACTDAESFRNQNLLIVCAEAICTQAFKTVCTELIAHRKIRRIYIDECHMCILADCFRPAYKTLHQLAFLDTAFCLMTATLPLHIEHALVDRFFPVAAPRIVRGKSCRPNIEYSVRSKMSIENLSNIAIGFCNKNQRDQKMIIFIRNKNEIEQLHVNLRVEEVECAIYHGDLNDVEKMKNFEHWKSKNCQIMIATNAFGLGVDFAAVRLVVNYGAPKLFEDFLQESGRAGRDGKLAKSILILTNSFRNGNANEGPSEAAMRAFSFSTNICLRRIISTFCDDFPMSCSMSQGATKCYVCCSSVVKGFRVG